MRTLLGAALMDLYALRVQADYHLDESFRRGDAEQALEIAQDIIANLNLVDEI
ncbi:MAG: hypothetical protein KIT38_09235 [Gemmatimonadaceae bacterium]|nr:hypothetical protein [Gemmatimonadaceae bacterium]